MLDVFQDEAKPGLQLAAFAPHLRSRLSLAPSSRGSAGDVDHGIEAGKRAPLGIKTREIKGFGIHLHVMIARRIAADAAAAKRCCATMTGLQHDIILCNDEDGLKRAKRLSPSVHVRQIAPDDVENGLAHHPVCIVVLAEYRGLAMAFDAPPTQYRLRMKG